MTEISRFTQLLIYLEGMQSSATNRLEYLDQLTMEAQKEVDGLRGRADDAERDCLRFRAALQEIGGRIDSLPNAAWTGADAAVMHEIAEKALYG